jgi:hypothetical protein
MFSEALVHSDQILDIADSLETNKQLFSNEEISNVTTNKNESPLNIEAFDVSKI